MHNTRIKNKTAVTNKPSYSFASFSSKSSLPTPMRNVSLASFLLLKLAMLWCTTAIRCPNCGRTPVPYPLSTGPNCGDQSYKVQCNAGTLWFHTLNNSYPVTSVDPLAQRIVIRPPGLTNKNTCVAADFQSQGILLDSNLPFNISASNTVILLNCSSDVLTTSFNCSSNSICHDYVRRNPMASSACGKLSLCCTLKTGGSQNAYKLRVRKERCVSYVSFVNLDTTLDASKWPQPGVEMQWALPEEPGCNLPLDCQGLANSVCLPDPSSAKQKKCLCKTGFKWDPFNGICQKINCKKFKGKCKRKKSLAPVIGGSAFAVIAMLIGGSSIFIIKRRDRNVARSAQLSLKEFREEILNANRSTGKSAKIFTSKEITKATNNFSKDNLLGSGGFGDVFKATFEDGTVTAVKKAKAGNTKGVDQILNEVRILCQVNHRSLVRIMGCCLELQQPVLIYEYVSNGTLFEHLHGSYHSTTKKVSLTWVARLKIAHQTAEGLAYLHDSVEPRIYHRDIKSSNILLDEKLNAKVADFGLSRLAVTESSHITTCAQGTLGYLDPDYYLNFQLTDKSDVYSFGVVLLELLTGKKAIDFNRQENDVNLVVYVKNILKDERLNDAIDPKLKDEAGTMELETMKALGSLAAACLEERRQNRPPMKDVANEIEYIISIVNYK